MKCANSIVDFYNNLSPHTILFKNKDDEQYVPVYEETLTRLRSELIANQRHDATFYIAGQSGTGKTTAMNFLPNDKLDEKFKVVYLYGRDLFDPNDVDIVDILLMFSFKLIEDNQNLSKVFYDKLEKIYQKHIGGLKEEVIKQKGTSAEAEINSQLSLGIQLLGWLKAKAGFFASFKMDAQYRKITRTFFQFKKMDLLELANQIIDKLYEDLEPGKNLLVIFDDLDKMRNIDQIRSVFIDNRNYLNQIRCKKIIAIPVHLPSLSQFQSIDAVTYFFELKLKYNPLVEHSAEERKKQDEVFSQNKKLLKEIIYKRICAGCDLIDEKAVEKAIEMSGGLLRQYIRIIHTAASRVMSLGIADARISLNDIDDALMDERNLMGRSVIGKERIDMLNNVRLYKTPNLDDNLFIESILGNHIIVFQNGDPWYDLNPVIETTVKQYAPDKE